MESHLSPTWNEKRRISLQPPPPRYDHSRRLTCPSKQLREQQLQFFNNANKRVSTGDIACTANIGQGVETRRLKKTSSFIETINSFFKQKPWNSEENLHPGTLNDSLNSSTNSLRVSPLANRKEYDGSTNSLKLTSPLTSKQDFEQFDFVIPRTSPIQKQVSIHNERPSLGKIDVSHYLFNDDESQDFEQVGGTQLRLGEAKFSIVYNTEDAKLKFLLKSVSIFLKPSASVVGCNWVCEPVTYIELFPDKKKPVEINYSQEHLINIKNDDVNKKTIRLTIYDIRRKHMKNPIGYVLLPLRGVPNLNKLNVHSKKINFNSQPAGFNKGNINISLSWAISGQRMEVKIGNVTNIRNEEEIIGKDFYMKMTIYIMESKYKSFKTSLVKSAPDVNFREKFLLPLTSAQLKDTTMLFQLYMKTPSKKKIANKVLIGKTIIGPYMKHADRTLSQWEKMITSPLDEISESHVLYI